MNLGQASYLGREAFRTMRRHKGITLVSIIIMSLSLLILAVFLLVTDNMLIFLEKTKEEMKIYAYLKDTLSDANANELYKRIMLDKRVENVIFISKDEAITEFEKQMGEGSNLLEAIETNPLPASLRITPKTEFKEKETIEKLAKEIALMEGIDEVNYGKEFLERFTSLTKGFLYVDAVVGLIAILSSLFIIANTVRLAVVSRKETINILMLVGATNRFITTPFLIEGAFQGGVAAAISLVLLLSISLAIKNLLPSLAFFSAEKALLYVLVCLAMGAGGSLTALRRFLRV